MPRRTDLVRRTLAFGVAGPGIGLVLLDRRKGVAGLLSAATASLWTKDEQCIGYLGELHPTSMKAFDLS